MDKPQKIYLVGMMGSGKSHWSSRLGRKLGLPHFDLDRLVEQQQGLSVREIFEQRGEDAFRQMESDMLKHGIPAESFILATGGGTPCFFDNMEFMKSHGLTIWLNPSIEELILRIKKSPGTRPILAEVQTDAELGEKLQQLLEKRKAWYAQAAIIVDDDYLDIADLEALLGDEKPGS
jgi:shikimate kinase